DGASGRRVCPSKRAAEELDDDAEGVALVAAKGGERAVRRQGSGRIGGDSPVGVERPGVGDRSTAGGGEQDLSPRGLRGRDVHDDRVPAWIGESVGERI